MISVIVPVYNVEPYLRKCLDSIVNQTYRDLEILVIDDGSTDGYFLFVHRGCLTAGIKDSMVVLVDGKEAGSLFKRRCF